MVMVIHQDWNCGPASAHSWCCRLVWVHSYPVLGSQARVAPTPPASPLRLIYRSISCDKIFGARIRIRSLNVLSHITATTHRIDRPNDWNCAAQWNAHSDIAIISIFRTFDNRISKIPCKGNIPLKIIDIDTTNEWTDIHTRHCLFI
jgi:hypothetical protein